MALPLISFIAEWLVTFDVSNARHIANFHMAFNIALAILFLPLINRMAKLTQRLIPEEEDDPDDFRPMNLDKSMFENPLVALVNAEREVLRMGEIVERMFRNTFIALKKNDVELAKKTRKMDQVANQFYDEIKLYLTRLSRESLGEKESKRCNEIMTFATNLEHIGDIISVDMIDSILRKKLVNRSKMSLQDREDINSLYQPVLTSFTLSLNVFTSGDIQMAPSVTVEKIQIYQT